MTDKDRLAIELFNEMLAKKERGELPAEGAIEVAPMRVRLAAHVDLTRASPDCESCNGSGVVRHEQLGKVSVRVVCSCVRDNGGVQEDALDRAASADRKTRVGKLD